MLFFGGGKSSGSSSSASKGSGGKQDVAELGKEWKRNLQKEIRNIDKDITNIKRAEDRASKECRALAKKNQMSSARILAKEIVQTRKALERLYTAKATLNSVVHNLQHTVATAKMQGCLSKSAEIMHSMNELVSVKEISATMATMAREMERAGLVEEIIGETMESLEEDGIDAEADAEVDRIVMEITQGQMEGVGAVPTNKPAVAETNTVQEEVAQENDAATEDLLKRIHAL